MCQLSWALVSRKDLALTDADRGIAYANDGLEPFENVGL